MRKKLIMSYLTVLTIGVIITGLFSIKFERDFYVKNLEDKMVTSARFISQLFMQSYEHDENIKNYDEQVKSYARIVNARVTIIRTNGIVLGESDRDSSTMENHGQREEVKAAIRGSTGKSLRYSTTEGIDMMYIAVPASPEVIVRLAMPLTRIKYINRNFGGFAIFAILAGLLGASIIAYSFTGKITKPIKQITEISSQFAHGSYDKRINLRSDDEIGQLAETFNNMAQKLEVTISDLSDKNNKLEAILKSIQSGVIAVDNIGRIMLVNPSAVSMFGFNQNVVGKHILEVIRNVDLEDIIYRHQETNEEIKLNYPEKRILRVKAAPIKDAEGRNKNMGVVVVMQDITELKQLEQVRSEFVANVSHELKTPLTSIKGFAETLKSGAAEDRNTRDKFLDIINIEADRLTRLINDILTISELENKRQNVAFESVNVNNALGEIEDMMMGLAKLKNIALTFEKQERIHNIKGNYDKFKQLLINLIDNAIKYTHDGGSVSVSTYEEDGNVVVKVSDTGIGISKEHMQRLFERFYRVDKGRSRALGGTGLGLAIVKHIVVSMNGDIKVESEPGKGTTFIVYIPQE